MKITLGLDSTSLTRRYPRLAILVTLFMAFGVPLGLYVAALAIFPLNTPERLNAMAQQWFGFDLAGSPYRNVFRTVQHPSSSVATPMAFLTVRSFNRRTDPVASGTASSDPVRTAMSRPRL